MLFWEGRQGGWVDGWVGYLYALQVKATPGNEGKIGIQ